MAHPTHTWRVRTCNDVGNLRLLFYFQRGVVKIIADRETLSFAVIL